jgi:soluble lytic murein transglycosylase-like protein
MAANPQLASQIYNEALSQGVPPAIALAVAQQESGVQQWTPAGGLVTGSAGEVGVFQIMPATAAGLGIDPSDVNQNITGGISLLSQLYQQYGNWAAALSAYNSGSPTGSPGYANSVLALAGSVPVAPSSSATTVDLSTIDLSGDNDSSAELYLVGGLVLGVGVLWWLA